MPATRGAFAPLLAPGLNAVIYDELAQQVEEYTQIFNVYPSTSAYEEDQLVAGLGAVPPKPEGEAIALDEPIQGGSYRYTHTSYGLGFQVTIEMWQDDKYSIMKKVSQDFAQSIRQTLEATSAGILNNAFTASTGTLTIDGVNLANTAHPLLGGGTYSNRSATDIALSVTGLQEVLLLFENIVNERGLIRRLTPERLVFNPALQFTAAEILHSQYKPYTGNNEVNTVQGVLSPSVNHYLTSATAWHVFAAQNQHSFKFFWRHQPTFDSQDDFFTKGASFSTFFRFSCGVTYWHGYAGSNGV